MKKLKIVSKGWTGYTGQLGIIRFVDGVSEVPVPQNIADSLTGLVQFVEVDGDGNEGERAGIAHRLVRESAARVPVIEPLKRQTEAERVQEERLEALRAEKAPVEKFFTVAQLEDLASEKGMKGLREIGDAWGVKERSIPKLIGEILKAQSNYLERRNKRLDQLSQRARAALIEAEIERQRKLEEDKRKREEADKEASTILGLADMPSAYVAGDKVIPAAVILEAAWNESRMTVTGWNNLDVKKRDEFIQAEIGRLERVHGAKLEPQVIRIVEDEPLAGSDVLADSYEIAGRTVALGEIVAKAFELSGMTAKEWNEQPDEAREDLLRAQLDRMLAGE